MTFVDESIKYEPSEEEISPTEDLMREHGVLKRILLIYDDIIKRLTGQKPYYPEMNRYVLYHTAAIAYHFIENYHQQLEEEYVFPKFLKAGQQVELVKVLLTQHNAARQITSLILQFSSAATGNNSFFQGYYLVNILSQYIRLYEPHEAREDTIIFPEFRRIVEPDELKRLGHLFEEIEEQRFGKNGFQRIVDQIARLEIMLGIYDLSQFTPHLYEVDAR